MEWRLSYGIALLPLCVFAGCAPPDPSSAPEPSARLTVASAPPTKTVNDLGEGFLVWESNRSGRWRLWIRDLAGGEPRQLTPDEGRRLHCCAHISPDGQQMVYLSLPADQGLYPPGGAIGRLMSIRPTGKAEPRTLVESARNYYENRAAVWRSPTELIYIRPDGSTALLDLDSGESKTLSPASGDTGPWLINSTLTWAASGNGAFAPFDRAKGRILDRGPRPGCQPYFSHDGIWGFWVVAPGGPIHRLHLESETDSLLLRKSDRRLPPELGYLYFPMLSADGRLLAFAASDNQHEHFEADYEILVVETDPLTLDILGQPIRFTHHPATDRFPDVYRSPLPLGLHFGEAPFRWRSTTDGNGQEWTWSYGDGDTSQGTVGEHLYTRPGRYDILARSGDIEQRGQVLVAAAAPPTVLAVTPRRHGSEISIVFDEAVDISDLDARLESGIAIAEAVLDRQDRRLVLRLADPLTGADVLVLEGIDDHSQTPNRLPPTSLALEPPLWPATRDGLTLLWETGDAVNLLYDPDLGAETAVTLTPRGLARLDSDFRLQPAGGRFEASEAASRRVVRQSKDTYEISIELTITPGPARPQRPAVIVTSASKSRRNFTLEQQGSKLLFTPRMKSRGENAFPRLPLMQVAPERPSHIVVTYRPGLLQAFHDGEEVLTETAVQGGFFHWRPAPVIFGSDWDGRRPWRGRIEGVAIHSRALEPEEVRESFRRYRSKVETRPQRSTWKIRGRLVACSTAPTLKQIDPYREALVVCHYEVAERLSGGDLPNAIQVAQWSMLDGQQLLSEAAIGTDHDLDLGLLDENPQLESVYLSDTLEPSVGGRLFFLLTP